MINFIKNNFPLLIYFAIALYINTGYLKNYGVDVWYWCTVMPLTFGALIFFIYKTFKK